MYGGGNNATITDNTTIFINNASDDLQTQLNRYAEELHTANYYPTLGDDINAYKTAILGQLMKVASLNSFQSDLTSLAFNHARIYGGNNRAAMAIRPTWNVQKGIIRDIYSGGNQGAMTSPEGILLEIDPANGELLTINNVYGGCRMADVMPTVNGIYTPCSNLQDKDEEGNLIYKFPPQLSARTLVRGGNINNVYGGNDITGKVYGGNAVGIYTTINGDVYGGGNGAYAYSDNAELAKDPTYSDFVYTTPTLAAGATDAEKAAASVEAMNAYRPNAEQVSIRLKGKEPASPGDKPKFTIIKGGVYVGGNCATISTNLDDPLVELKIGSYALADKVFLGNNGAGMVNIDTEVKDPATQFVIRQEGSLRLYKNTYQVNGTGAEQPFSSLNLTDPSTFAKFMSGAAMSIHPRIVFDNTANGDPTDYKDYSTYIGSFFCGGNVGSMTIPGKNTYSVNRGLYIFNKFVGGCNNANVLETAFNAAYEGGVLGSEAEQASYMADGKILDRLELNLKNLTIEPLRWRDATKTAPIWNTVEWGLDGYAPLEEGTKLTAGTKYYTHTYDSGTDSDTYDEYTANGLEVANGCNYFEKVNAGTGTKSGFADIPNTGAASNENARLIGGNVYGGCYNSGHVNGNVIINANDSLMNPGQVFNDAKYASITRPDGRGKSGVFLENQRDDLLSTAMSVFGAGYGKDTEIWGSTTLNLNKGYAFQYFGGGQEGIVGKPIGTSSEADRHYDEGTKRYTTNGKLYEYNPAYSTTINLKGVPTTSDDDEDVVGLAETEYIYGGGNEGDVCGDTHINLGNGRIYDSFGGACDANVLGHTETYIGRSGVDASGNDIPGFPWVRDYVYGANDFGGNVWGTKDYKSRLNEGTYPLVHGTEVAGSKNVLSANCYVEYKQGHVDQIYGGNYGDYDYLHPDYEPVAGRPDITSAFVHIRPIVHDYNVIGTAFGGGEGHAKDRLGDKMQDRSYVLVDIPDNMTDFQEMNVFGAGKNNGLGLEIPDAEFNNPDPALRRNPDDASAIIDLVHGDIAEVFGGSWEEGITRRTVVNVPSVKNDAGETTSSSTIKVQNIFGGAYGTQILPPCDVFESNINYNSENAYVSGAVYGGNNNERRTLFTKVNINSSVKHPTHWTGLSTVYGAGKGIDTWTEYTEVNLNNGAKVREVYGGGEMGHVLNAESVQKYMQLYKTKPSPQISADDPTWKDPERWTGAVGTSELKSTYLDDWKADWADAWTIGDYYVPTATDGDGFTYTDYATNSATNLEHPIIPQDAEMDVRDYTGYTEAEKAKRFKKYNTNVKIHDGASVARYAYGGGYGDTNVSLSGDVYGTTYIALLGGTVTQDIYAAGTAGAVYDLFGVGAYDASSNTTGFTASANVYIQGGTCRNVYGGGWRGSVGYANYTQSATPIYESSSEKIYEKTPNFWNASGNYTDVLGEANVVIGKTNGDSYVNGIPSITRNAYGGGEGGGVYGIAHVYINNGYIGYRYNPDVTDDAATTDYDERYVPELDDSPGDGKLEARAGCVFGGGYVGNSYVDNSDVQMYGGNIRGSLYGGGEIGPIGRGTVKSGAKGKETGLPYTFENANAKIYKGGSTKVQLFDGKVGRNVFGGGRGFDNWNGNGWMTEGELATMDLSSKGYVFGSTEVHIHGGEISTPEGAIKGDGNVFGGGDQGFVYSATGTKMGTRVSDESLVNGLPTGGGGYYYNDTDKDGKLDTGEKLTLDCNVLIDPYCKTKGAVGIENTYAKDATVPASEIAYINANNLSVKSSIDANGIVTANGGITYTHSYSAGEYVPVEALNQLRNWNADRTTWEKLDTRGVTIHNAIFAGGNTIQGSELAAANSPAVFGNAAASLRDVYNYDLISVGTDELGGLYGDGNLTLVDGFRELHIDNYGTDKYGLSDQLSETDYNNLSDRQKAYYQLRYITKEGQRDNHIYDYYQCTEAHTYGSETYKRGQKVTEATYNAFTTAEKKYWIEGRRVFQPEELIDAGEWQLMDAAEQAKWERNGVCTIYAGRPMNTLQRADFCGVWGSRMVLKGAPDRVAENDNSSYTINRVDEVSLNQRASVNATDLATDPATDENAAKHGNYFGIYNKVNYLGNLTSDVSFETGKDVRTTNTSIGSIQADGTTTYYGWKEAKPHDKYRNNGTSRNKVALASGVYLEIKREETETAGEDKWGFITGVVELDLINVMTGMGGGYVYARNEHGVKTYHSDYGKVNLLDANNDAITYRRYTYTLKTDKANLQEIETSGNFIHNVKQIVDDCYPNSGIYNDEYKKSPAHYWYIKGSIYVYDQYISAYTGSASAYAETVNLPLTITAGSNGRLLLNEVQPNYYAFYDKDGNKIGDPTLANPEKDFVANGITYKLNDPISYWEYTLLTEGEKAKFVEDTYVTVAECTLNGTTYPAGYVMLPGNPESPAEGTYAYLKQHAPKGKLEDTDTEEVLYVEDENGKRVAFDDVFRPSNNLSHNTGYILTYDVNNPLVWDNYYTKKDDPSQTSRLDTLGYFNSSSKSDYIEGPTYTLKSTASSSVYGQQTLKMGSIISQKALDAYTTKVVPHLAYTAVTSGTTLTKGKTYYTSNTGEGAFIANGTESATGSNYYTPTKPQAEIQQAYVVKTAISVLDTEGHETNQLNPGLAIVKSDYTDAQWATFTGKIEEAKVCTALLQFSETDYVYAGKLLTAADIATLKTKVINANATNPEWSGLSASEKDAKAATFLEKFISNAYYCTETGLYGGSYYEQGHAYRSLETFNDMSAEERANFEFNYDALDLLIDPNYGTWGEDYRPQYDGWKSNGTKETHANNPKIYTDEKPVDYQAEYTGTAKSYYKADGTTKVDINPTPNEADWWSREDYEAIPNEQRHYAPIIVKDPGNYYVAKQSFMHAGVPFGPGQTMSEDVYKSLPPQEKAKVDVLDFTALAILESETGGVKIYKEQTYYYCREAYDINEKGMGANVTYQAMTDGTEGTTIVTSTQGTYTKGTETSPTSVPKGTVIPATTYGSLPNYQTDFVIHGTAPTETSTLYVNSAADIHDLSKEKIITVIYKYTAPIPTPA